MFNFNLYSSLLLIGFLQGMVYALMLFRRSVLEERPSDRWLAWLLTVSCIYIMQYMLGFGGWYDIRNWRSTLMFYFPFHLVIFVGPLMYFYFRSLTNQAFRLQGRDYWHFLPGAIVLAIYVFIFLRDVVVDHWILGHAFPLHSGTQGTWSKFRQDELHIITLGLISTIIYTILTIKVYRRYQSYLRNNFSAIEGIRFRWLRFLLYAIIIALAVNWGVQILTIAIDVSYQQYWTSYFAFAIMIYILAIQGYASAAKLPKHLQFEPATIEPSKNQDGSASAEVIKWRDRLSKYMRKEQPFLEPQLTLSELAQRLNTNTSILSKAINTGFGLNFNDFINNFRVLAVQEKLKQGENRRLTLTSIAYDCGFNSKATFNRAFKKNTGMTPREFLETID